MKNQPAARSLRFRIGLFVLAWVLVFIGFVGYRIGFRPTENQRAAKAQISFLKDALLDYQKTCGQLPTTEQGLEALVTNPDRGPVCNRYPADSFLPDGKVPKDPWDNLFVYSSSGNNFTLTSLGKDGKEGGEGYDKDISTN